VKHDGTNTAPTADAAPNDDTDLMLATRHGDEAAFTVLVRRHQKMILNYFLRLGVQYDAEDLVQQTFLRLYRYRKRYQPRAKFTTFLFLLARQVWIDDLRKRKRAERLTEALTREAEIVATDDHGQHDHEMIDVHGAVAKLPEAMRQVVELGVFQDLPYADVAQILKIPLGTVKSRMFNAIRLLREDLNVKAYIDKKESDAPDAKK